MCDRVTLCAEARLQGHTGVWGGQVEAFAIIQVGGGDDRDQHSGGGGGVSGPTVGTLRRERGRKEGR